VPPPQPAAGQARRGKMISLHSDSEEEEKGKDEAEDEEEQGSDEEEESEASEGDESEGGS